MFFNKDKNSMYERMRNRSQFLSWRDSRKKHTGVYDSKNLWKRAGILAGIFLIAIYMSVGAAERSILQQGIAEEVLRFHVLANSDSEADQVVKYRVRDAVLEWMSQEMQQENISNYELANHDTVNDSGLEGTEENCDTKRKNQKEAVESFAQRHLKELEYVANQVLSENGMDYQATAEIVRCYFPDRTYGACTFPAGWYEALRIRLGEAEGQNWWCVLYPQLCFQDCLHAVVEEEQQQELEAVLTVEEYESLLQKPQKWKLAFKWF